MRIKGLHQQFQKTNSKIDIEKIKTHNPALWKKLKKQFDTGRKIVVVQLHNGLDRANENTLRYYLQEYANRFVELGPKSFPTSFNTLEPFFLFNHHNSIVQLLPDEESYGVSLVDFLDFVTDKNFELDEIDFYDNIPENTIFHFSFTGGFDELNFSNNEKKFIIGGLSLVRQGNDVSMLMQAGEQFEKEEAIKYFKRHDRDFLEQSISPSKKALGMRLEDNKQPDVITFNGREDLWAHNVGILFDLKEQKIDLRFVARDENLSFKVFTDDYYAMFNSADSLSKEEIKEYYEGHLESLSDYDAVFDFSKYCLALPYYVFENEKRIVDVTYETKLNSIIKSPISKRDYSQVPAEFKVFAKPLYFLESNEQVVIKNIELNDQSFQIQKSGFWKRLDITEEGFDKSGNKIIGKTWVERNKQKKIAVGVVAFLIISYSIMNDSDFEISGAVRQSPWDNSVDCVESYVVQHYLRDPGSYESVRWGKVSKNADGTYSVTHTYRAKNGFGGYQTQTNTFVIAKDGWTVTDVY